MTDGKENQQYRAKVVTSTEEFADMEKEWNDLLASSPADTYFLRWEWLWNWWQVFARNNDELRIIKIENKDEIIAIAPFYVRKKLRWRFFPVRQMMFLGTQEEGEGDVCSDYLNIIIKEGEEKTVVDIIFGLIANDDLCDESYFPRMDSSSKVFQLIWKKSLDDGLLSRILNEYESPYINLPATWDDYLNGLSGAMRWKIRRQKKKMQALTNGTFSRAKTYEELNTGFDELIRLHQTSWESRGFLGSFSNEQFTQFHRLMVRHIMEKGHLELVLLYAENELKAALYNIVYNNTIYCYQSGTNRDGNNIAFGYLVHSYCIEEAIKSGRKVYDFLPKGERDDYKDHFANGNRKVYDLYMVRNGFVKSFVKVEDIARAIYRQTRSWLEKN